MQSIAAIQQQRITFERTQALNAAAKKLLAKLLGPSQDEVTRQYRFSSIAQLGQASLQSTVQLNTKRNQTFQKDDEAGFSARQRSTDIPPRRIVPSFCWSSVQDEGKVRFFVVPNSPSSSLSPTEIHGVSDDEDEMERA